MSEMKRVLRVYILTVLWVLFVTLTLSGLTVAGERTAAVMSGKEPETVIFSITEKIPLIEKSGIFNVHNYYQ